MLLIVQRLIEHSFSSQGAYDTETAGRWTADYVCLHEPEKHLFQEVCEISYMRKLIEILVNYM